MSERAGGNLPLSRRIALDGAALASPTYHKVRGKLAAFANDVADAMGSEAEFDEPLWEQWRRVLRRSGGAIESLPPANGPRVLLATIYGQGGAMLALETILATALRLRGARPTILVCDVALPACEWNPNGNHSLPALPGSPPATERSAMSACRYCTLRATSPYELLPVERLTLRELSKPQDLPAAVAVVDALDPSEYAAFRYRGIPVGEAAKASTHRALLRGTLLDDEPTRALFRRYLISTVMMVEVAGRAFDRVAPDRFVVHHGIYATHGTATEIARARGIPVAVHGIPYRKDTVIFSHGDTYHRTLITEPTTEWENRELSPSEKAEIDDYVSSKRFGGRDYMTFHAHAVEDRAAIARELRLDPALPLATAYTNVLWDALLYYRHNAFPSMLDWLWATIGWFEKRTDLQLAIRVHPAEKRGLLPTAQPIVDEIERAYPTLPTNVKIVPAESDVSSYTLAEMSAAAIIYGARMGMEIALAGTPLIIAGETFNRGKGYSYDAESPKEYFDLLDRIPALPRNSPAMVERARKYAHHMYFRRMMDFPLFTTKNSLNLAQPRLTFRSLADLEPGRVPALDVVADGVLRGTPFVLDSKP